MLPVKKKDKLQYGKKALTLRVPPDRFPVFLSTVCQSIYFDQDKKRRIRKLFFCFLDGKRWSRKEL
jgi:hypothetical protein